jgi:hypothetical protein
MSHIYDWKMAKKGVRMYSVDNYLLCNKLWHTWEQKHGATTGEGLSRAAAYVIVFCGKGVA